MIINVFISFSAAIIYDLYSVALHSSPPMGIYLKWPAPSWFMKDQLVRALHWYHTGHKVQIPYLNFLLGFNVTAAYILYRTAFHIFLCSSNISSFLIFTCSIYIFHNNWGLLNGVGVSVGVWLLKYPPREKDGDKSIYP